MSQSNRREFTRVDAKVRAEISAGSRSVIAHETRDVSMKGLFLPCEAPLAAGTECDVTIDLGETPEEGIRARARVARVTEEGMGLEFINLVGLQSYNNLRGLVMLHAHNREQVQSEITERRGPRPADS